jgi:SAM-dependent methyltransferase
MTLDDRFDDLVTSLGGFYRAWVIQLGLEVGLFAALRAVGPAGLTTEELASRTATAPDPVATWCRAAYASDLVECAEGRIVLDEITASILLDVDRPEYLGGQFLYTVTASLDYGDMAHLLQTGRVVEERPPRYYRSIEQLTRQDIAVFFEEALAMLPDLVADLWSGGEIADMHCGGGRWLVAMAQRFPRTRLVGLEAEPDSVARALRNVDEAGLSDRIRVEAREVESVGREDTFDLVYFQHALHELRDKPNALAAAYRSVKPGGRLLVLSWCLPSTVDEYRSAHGEIASGIALDELLQGTPLQTREDTRAAFRGAGLPEPEIIELPSDATLFHLRRTGGA